MAIIVQKFGGTSVADVEHIQAVAKRVKAEVDNGNQVAVTVSAMKSRMKVPARSSPGLPSHIQCKAFGLRTFLMTVDFASNAANSIAQPIGVIQPQVAEHAQRDILRVSIRIGRPTWRISSKPLDCSKWNTGSTAFIGSR